jgi:energy-coupling factor transporter ATP-binding protein EcfA2
VSGKRVDLAIELKDSGSGVGQILAMLYVVVTSERPRVILIDEPQSFLHPGAIRKLFEIFAQYKRHQYILSTHSPAGLNITADANYLLVQRGQDQSTVTQLDAHNQAGISVFLSEIGSRPSDVFGSDAILWVEGKTEERCFPLLVREVAGSTLGGTQILGIVNTGDLEGDLAERVFEIYQRLSASPSILPTKAHFLFDREGRTKQQCDDVVRRGGGLVRLLPRRMYENYLLEPSAISELINAFDPDRPQKTGPEEVLAWISSKGCGAEYFADKKEVAFNDPQWIEVVDGAKLLKALVYEITDSRLRYDKVAHGELLTRYLVRNPTQALRELDLLIADLCR